MDIREIQASLSDNIEKFTGKIFYNDMMAQFQRYLKNVKKSKSQYGTPLYWSNFISYCNTYPEMTFEGKDYQVQEFMYLFFNDIPFAELIRLKGNQVKRNAVKMAEQHFIELVKNEDKMMRLLTFYNFDANAWSVVNVLYPKFFTGIGSASPQFRDQLIGFWKTVLKFQKVPASVITSVFHGIACKQVILDLFASDNFQYFYDILFKNNLQLFHKCREIAGLD